VSWEEVDWGKAFVPLLGETPRAARLSSSALGTASFLCVIFAARPQLFWEMEEVVVSHELICFS